MGSPADSGRPADFFQSESVGLLEPAGVTGATQLSYRFQT
jgi:hypothetical protein